MREYFGPISVLVRGILVSPPPLLHLTHVIFEIKIDSILVSKYYFLHLSTKNIENDELREKEKLGFKHNFHKSVVTPYSRNVRLT